MTETSASLQRKIHSAGDLQAVVSAMKAIATISIGQYQDSVQAQQHYFETVQSGLLACLQQTSAKLFSESPVKSTGAVAALVFGSDQGLVGQFNETLADFVVEQLAALPGEKLIWAVGERIQARLMENNLSLQGSFVLPNAIGAIAGLITEILSVLEMKNQLGLVSEVYLYHNRPTNKGIYEQAVLKLLPLDERWRNSIVHRQWPGKNLPEVLGSSADTLLSFVHEYLFVALFRACAESLASENASRLAAMHRAEKNIDELLDAMQRQFHQLRQSGIDEELFDQVSATLALAKG